MNSSLSAAQTQGGHGADLVAIRSTFFPFFADARERVLAQRLLFAYYTTAETAFRILKNEEIWMRSTMTMNDFSEVTHGLDCVHQVLNSKAGEDFSSALDDLFPSASQEVKRHFSAWSPVFSHDTFIACFSEHHADEDHFGRLSMWRAYGASAGIALVLNVGAMFAETTALAAYSSPVAYMRKEDLETELNRVAVRIRENKAFVQAMGQHRVVGTALTMLRFAAVCTKHPGFKEEREWRVIASPEMQSSPLLPCEIEVVRGVPQPVLKLKLQDQPDLGLVGLDLKSLVNRVIIGPCEYPAVVHQALRRLLLDKGFSDNDIVERVFVSDIPLRSQ